MSAEQYEGQPDLVLPPFPAEGDWLNVPRPLTLEDLRGKIVLLDFWTYGCINCIHMIPVLQQLEAKYPDELVVIGVHSAKFKQEGHTPNVREIVRRYDLHHPVINDPQFKLWDMLGIKAWPTFIIVDPRGNVLAAQGGEIPFEGFDQLIDGMVAHFDALGELDRAPLDLTTTKTRQPDSLLLYPGKVIVTGNRLLIADSSHHRVIVADLATYQILDVIGSGDAGYHDGDFESAQFNTPQGLALHGDTLYIADTDNHAIRTADLTTRTVDTAAGTGEIGQTVMNFGVPVREPRAFQLRSPWDVTLGAENTLFIAMAGMHQIWEMNLETGVIRVSVGNGRESVYNDTLATSELAQPSGLYFNNGLLYFADSESSTIRVADFTNDTVRTIAGTIENSLFDFGDVDGQLGTSRLQHPLGVTGDGEESIFIADTYNSKIKVIDAATNTETFLNTGFDEPGGIDYHDGKLYIADTNNHRLCVVDVASKQVSTIAFPNPERLLREGDAVTVIDRRAAEVRLPEQAVSAGEGAVMLRLTLPDGCKLNADAYSTLELRAEGGGVTMKPLDEEITSLVTEIPVILEEGSATLHGMVDLYYCEVERENLCLLERFTFQLPVSVGPPGGFERTITVERQIGH